MLRNAAMAAMAISGLGGIVMIGSQMWRMLPEFRAAFYAHEWTVSEIIFSVSLLVTVWGAMVAFALVWYLRAKGGDDA